MCHMLPVTKGSRKEDNKLMLVQTANPVIQSVVYNYESPFMYIYRELSSRDLSFSPCLSILVNTAYYSSSS
jgi:hypothetical protein